MMETATPSRDALQLRGAGCAVSDLSLSYCRVTAAAPNSQEMLKVKKRRFSPPQQPPPPPPSQDSAGSLATGDERRPAQRGAGDEDELESFKKLGLVVCPHRVDQQSNAFHTESADLAPHPSQDYPDSSTHGHAVPESHSLSSYSEPSRSTMSPSPLPLPEPDFQRERPLFQNMTHSTSSDILISKGNQCPAPVSSSFPPYLTSSPPPRTACMESIQPYSVSSTDIDYEERKERRTTPNPLLNDSSDDDGYVQLVRDKNSEHEGVSSTCCPDNPVSVSHHQRVSRQLPAHHHSAQCRQDEREYFSPTTPHLLPHSQCSLEEEQQVIVGHRGSNHALKTQTTPIVDCNFTVFIYESCFSQDDSIVLLTEEEPLFIGKTRPVPPPKQSASHTPLSSPPQHTAGKFTRPKILQSTQSSPALISSGAVRPRSISFLQCKAGDDIGKFSADYLGSREIDSYIGCVNTAAKQLTESKPIEVVAYVSSEKVRLAPPRNAALLFKSFAMRDILAVEMCTKNKRIVGLVVWKKGQKSVPVCHILRCANNLVSNSMYDSLICQTQHVDEASGFEVRSKSTCIN